MIEKLTKGMKAYRVECYSSPNPAITTYEILSVGAVFTTLRTSLGQAREKTFSVERAYFATEREALIDFTNRQTRMIASFEKQIVNARIALDRAHTMLKERSE